MCYVSLVRLFRIPLVWLCAFLMVLAGCGGQSARLSPVTAQPKTPVARNFTSFSPALSCMDRLLAQAGNRRIRLSSTGIPDLTYKVKVGADDMLINAISQMNRTSRSYVFIDQARMKDGRWLEIQVNNSDIIDDLPKPHFYIRGSISQLDAGVRSNELTATYQPADLPENRGVTSARAEPRHKTSVVSVDLHLVAFPTREIVPGASVSNSMVVTDNTWSAGMTGLIAKKKIGVTLKFQRLESTGQAVRNLVELGVIELLGRHANVPYWTCLSLPETEARPVARDERAFIRTTDASQLEEVQALMIQLGLLSSSSLGILDDETRRALARYQAERSLIASGLADFDTLQALKRDVARLERRQVAKPAVATMRASPRAVEATASGYRNLHEFLSGVTE